MTSLIVRRVRVDIPQAGSNWGSRFSVACRGEADGRNCHGRRHEQYRSPVQSITSARLNGPPVRFFHGNLVPKSPPPAPKTKERGPPSKEDTQTDFNVMDVFSNTPAPTTAIDACMEDGFALNSGLKVTGAGVLLVGGEAFQWRPWIRPGRKEGTSGHGGLGDDTKGVSSMSGKLLNQRGQIDIDSAAWGVLELVWPKPDLLILGTGPSMVPISPETRRSVYQLGVRIEVQDTRNAAAQFNLLATERGVQQVAAALVPVGWHERR